MAEGGVGDGISLERTCHEFVPSGNKGREKKTRSSSITSTAADGE